MSLEPTSQGCIAILIPASRWKEIISMTLTCEKKMGCSSRNKGRYSTNKSALELQCERTPHTQLASAVYTRDQRCDGLARPLPRKTRQRYIRKPRKMLHLANSNNGQCSAQSSRCQSCIVANKKGQLSGKQPRVQEVSLCA